MLLLWGSAEASVQCDRSTGAGRRLHPLKTRSEQQHHPQTLKKAGSTADLRRYSNDRHLVKLADQQEEGRHGLVLVLLCVLLKPQLIQGT